MAERNARQWQQGEVTQQRFKEITDDLRQTCEIVAMRQEWLTKNNECLLVCRGRWNRPKNKERRKTLQDCVAGFD